MPGELEGRVAIVTGGGRGFGRAIAMRLAAEGAAVAVTSRTAKEIEETADQIRESGGRSIAITGNVTVKDDVNRVVAESVKAFGPVSILVNNAGIPEPFGPIGIVDTEKWWAAQEVHIRGPVLFISAVLPEMIKHRQGTIINIAATAGRRIAPYLSAYCLGKAAQIRLTELLAAETEEHGICVFAIDPGLAHTGMAEATMNSADAQRWLPEMVDRLKQRKNLPQSNDDLEKCGQRCVALISGQYDDLSGIYMELDDDLDEMLIEKEADEITIIPADH